MNVDNNYDQILMEELITNMGLKIAFAKAK